MVLVLGFLILFVVGGLYLSNLVCFEVADEVISCVSFVDEFEIVLVFVVEFFDESEVIFFKCLAVWIRLFVVFFKIFCGELDILKLEFSVIRNVRKKVDVKFGIICYIWNGII